MIRQRALLYHLVLGKIGHVTLEDRPRHFNCKHHIRKKQKGNMKVKFAISCAWMVKFLLETILSVLLRCVDLKICTNVIDSTILVTFGH